MTREDTCDRLDRRRRAIMDAARLLFIEQGFERTTLADIVERAGGSLATIYKVFGSKEGLLDAVVFEGAASGESIIAEVSRLQLSPAETLRQIGQKLYARFLDPEDVALVRIVIARSIEDAAFARRFFETTAARTRSSLEGLFQLWAKQGIAMNGSPQMLAAIYLALLINDLQTEAISHGTVRQQSAEQLAERTDFFLRGAGLTET